MENEVDQIIPLDCVTDFEAFQDLLFEILSQLTTIRNEEHLDHWLETKLKPVNFFLL